uniref:S5 DRBM domain-containing protein n=1 Tax=Globodera rostochiensis TaxID=31243 RepID=A0A914HJU6_GLORO
MFERFLSQLSLQSVKVVQIRTKANTVNFFRRRTGEVLWKTVTQVSMGGMKRGRSRTRQAIRPLPQFYKVGMLKSSPLRVRYPGLNASIDHEDTAGKGGRVALCGDASGKESHEEARGGTYMGQRMGPPPDMDGTSMADFECICLFTDRTTEMHPIRGRVFETRALVFVGNGNKVGGYALGRASGFKVNLAIARAVKMASRSLFHIELHEDRTVYQDFFSECRNSRIFVQRQVEGFGLRAHPRLMKICELLGIKDLLAFVHGSTQNYIALTHAFVTGLLNQETHQRLADRTRLHVVELSPNRQYFPQIVASPLNTPVKEDNEVETKERMKLDDYYGEGRFPFKKARRKPFWAESQGHLHAEWKKHPYRNMEKKIIRMLADGVVKRWTRKERYRWAQREFELVASGQKPMPLGLGLTHVEPPEGEEKLIGFPVRSTNSD